MLVNNAGRTMRGKVLDTTPEQFRDLMELNLIALVRCTRAAAPHLLAERGHVVNIGSLAAKSAARWLGAYPATKFAVAAYSQQLRLELGPQGLHVLLVCPGPIQRSDTRLYPLCGLEDVPERARQPGGGGEDAGDSAAAAWPGRSCGRASVAGRSWSFPARPGCCSPLPSSSRAWATGSCCGRREGQRGSDRQSPPAAAGGTGAGKNVAAALPFPPPRPVARRAPPVRPPLPLRPIPGLTPVDSWPLAGSPSDLAG